MDSYTEYTFKIAVPKEKLPEWFGKFGEIHRLSNLSVIKMNRPVGNIHNVVVIAGAHPDFDREKFLQNITRIFQASDLDEISVEEKTRMVWTKTHR